MSFLPLSIWLHLEPTTLHLTRRWLGGLKTAGQVDDHSGSSCTQTGEESHTVRLGFFNLIRSSGTAATIVQADVTRETINRLAMRQRLSTVWAGERKAIKTDLVKKLHRENTMFLRFWNGVPTAAGSITARSKALRIGRQLKPTALLQLRNFGHCISYEC